ncbi:TrmB family transcriptional regulator [Faecalicoccus pleomorphus]|uniref:TrmB family transcriptional regulator n=1 Tax=Faecalicoccus pleomorphus TaxID=1323 RepID=A0A7X9NJJ8_9FIRM|nr:TrmB family transcriptional regulator [Faecalicoccus pleomorphus]NME45359.1 TrmB family transcriptional regulator [Faecalicoccus pleomorphus]
MSVIELLKNFQFTESEAKVYVALSQYGPQTGYEVSKTSGVPRSKVYNILESLGKRGIVCFSQSKRTKLYKAESIDMVCSLIENTIQETRTKLKREIELDSYFREDEQIWELNDWNLVKVRCLELLKQSQKQVLIQLWSQELNDEIEQALAEVQRRLKEVLIILYDEKQEYKTNLKCVYRHGYEKEKLEDMNGRWLLLTIDGRAMLYVTFDEKVMSHAIYTKKREMSFFAREYIMHDAYCLKILNQIEDLPVMDQLKDIRDVFYKN